MNKRYPKLVLRLIFYMYLIPIIGIVFDFDMFVIRNYTGRHSYIKSMSKDVNFRAEVAIASFEMHVGPNQVVPRKGKRPITVRAPYNIEKWYLGKNNLGFAIPNPASCVIVMNNDNIKTEHTWRSTFVHEYLHCLGYKHVDNYRDLMYPYNTGHDIEELHRWADKLKREMFYE